ncbi:MAG: helix-turn-helix transcriptional regulator [Acidobacteriota bacterium]
MPEHLEGSRLGNYLRRLRQNYGYTLRRVEERSQAIGECIDNSQLSRFEKGKSSPSFEKLRILAKVFNVSVQNFSDMLDLEVYDSHKPTGTNYQELMEQGAAEFESGNFGKAYMIFERCLEVSENGSGTENPEMQARARTRMAIALKKLGKLSMMESELRSILRHRAALSPQTQVRTLLQLSSVHREFGDRYLASILAHECHRLAGSVQDSLSEAASRQIIGNVCLEDGDPDGAVTHFETALRQFEGLGEEQKQISLLATLGEAYCQQNKRERGWRTLNRGLAVARRVSDRRGTAYVLHKMASVSILEGKVEDARTYVARSNLASEQGEERYIDILFANTFLIWKQACSTEHGTEAKIAFGRLKHLRSLLERRLPEVEQFDEFVRRTREEEDEE